MTNSETSDEVAGGIIGAKTVRAIACSILFFSLGCSMLLLDRFAFRSLINTEKVRLESIAAVSSEAVSGVFSQARSEAALTIAEASAGLSEDLETAEMIAQLQRRAGTAFKLIIYPDAYNQDQLSADTAASEDTKNELDYPDMACASGRAELMQIWACTRNEQQMQVSFPIILGNRLLLVFIETNTHSLESSLHKRVVAGDVVDVFLYSNALDHSLLASTASQKATPSVIPKSALARLERGHSGSALHKEKSGERVLYAWHPVPSSDTGVIVRSRPGALTHSLDQQRLYLSGIFITALLVTYLALGLLISAKQ